METVARAPQLAPPTLDGDEVEAVAKKPQSWSVEVDPEEGVADYVVRDLWFFDYTQQPHLSPRELRTLAHQFAAQPRGEPGDKTLVGQLVKKTATARGAELAQAHARVRAARLVWQTYQELAGRASTLPWFGVRPEFAVTRERALLTDEQQARALGRLGAELAFLREAAARKWPLSVWHPHATHLGVSTVYLAAPPLVLPPMHAAGRDVGGVLQAVLTLDDGVSQLRLCAYDPARRQFAWLDTAADHDHPKHCRVLLLPRGDCTIPRALKWGHQREQLEASKVEAAKDDSPAAEKAEKAARQREAEQVAERVARLREVEEDIVDVAREPLAALLEKQLWCLKPADVDGAEAGELALQQDVKTYLDGAVLQQKGRTHPGHVLYTEGPAALGFWSPLDVLRHKGDPEALALLELLQVALPPAARQRLARARLENRVRARLHQ